MNKQAEPTTLLPLRSPATAPPNEDKEEVEYHSQPDETPQALALPLSPEGDRQEEDEEEGPEEEDEIIVACEFQDEEEEDFNDPAMCAITYQQLMDLEVKARKKLGRSAYGKATMRDINRVIIEPSCKQTWKPYALQLNPKGLKIDAFITHAWDEPFEAFVESIRHVFHTKMNKPNLWICATALSQGDAETISRQVGTSDESLERSPFMRALSQATSYVVVRNSTVDVYSRMWCVAELLQAKKLGMIPHRTDVTGPDTFARLKTSCMEAEAYDPIDRARILKYILREDNCAEIDDFVYQFRAFAAQKTYVEKSKSIFMVAFIILVLTIGVAVGVGMRVSNNTRTTTNEAPSTLGNVPVNTANATPTDSASFTLELFGKPYDESTRSIDLVNLSLNGTVPTELGLLTALTMLNLPANQLTGTLPTELGMLTELNFLILAVNQLNATIPSELGSLTALTVLELSSNRFSGSIPSELGLLTALNLFVGVDNELTGTIPSELGKLTAAREIYLNSNQIKGTIPSELGSLTALYVFDVDNNQLTGTMPSELGQMAALFGLSLPRNQIKGTIPSELGLLSNMTTVVFYDNQLTGSIPEELGTLTRMAALLLNGNQLSGTVPASFCDLTPCFVDEAKVFVPSNCACSNCTPDVQFPPKWNCSVPP